MNYFFTKVPRQIMNMTTCMLSDTLNYVTTCHWNIVFLSMSLVALLVARDARLRDYQCKVFVISRNYKTKLLPYRGNLAVILWKCGNLTGKNKHMLKYVANFLFKLNKHRLKYFWKVFYKNIPVFCKFAIQIKKLWYQYQCNFIWKESW